MLSHVSIAHCFLLLPRVDRPLWEYATVVYPLIYRWTFEKFLLWAVVTKKVTMNIGLQALCGYMIGFLFPGLEWLCYMDG